MNKSRSEETLEPAPLDAFYEWLADTTGALGEWLLRLAEDRSRENYLGAAVDHADLERRMRAFDRGHVHTFLR